MRNKWNGFLIAGCVITALMIGLIILGCFWTPFDPTAMSGKEKFLAPTLQSRWRRSRSAAVSVRSSAR